MDQLSQHQKKIRAMESNFEKARKRCDTERPSQFDFFMARVYAQVIARLREQNGSKMAESQNKSSRIP